MSALADNFKGTNNYWHGFRSSNQMKNGISKIIKLNCIVFAVALCFCGFKTQQAIYPEQVDWDTHYLASPDQNSAFAALTTTNWHYSYHATVQNNHLHIDFSFSGGVVPSQSWVKRNRIGTRKLSRQLLAHEQGHVYINFLLLKNGEVTMQNQNYTPSNYKRLIVATGNKVGKYYSDMQSRYDIETEHGANLNAQDRWDNILQQQLQKVN